MLFQAVFLSLVLVTLSQDLIFEDNFDTFNLNVWEHELTAGGGGNWEFQLYTNNRSNSYVRDGTLFIKPTLMADRFGEAFLSSGLLDIWGNTPPNECTGAGWYGCFRQGTPDNYLNPIQSARVRTAKTFSFTYGRVEVRAKMPKGDWLWPAIWMLPAKNAYGDWPSSGEIDLIESRGNLDLTDETGAQKGHTHGGTTLHWGPFFEGNRYDLTTGDVDSDFSENFHVFAAEWTSEGISMYIDETEVFSAPGSGSFWELGGFDQSFPGIDNPWAAGSRMAPFDQDFYIVLNVAVGGTNGFFPDTWTNAAYPKPWLNTSPFAPREFWLANGNWYPTWEADVNNGENAALQVDYVRVYSAA